MVKPELVVVWSGGELLPPRPSVGWAFDAESEGPASGAPPRGVPSASFCQWKDRGFRMRVLALVQVGHSRRRVANMLGVTVHQVQSAVRREGV
jgi:hypothetical protein